MALISNGRITAGLSGNRQMSESEWTKLLLERGEAELAKSEKRWLAASKSLDKAVSQTAAEPPAEGLSARAHVQEAPPSQTAPDPVPRTPPLDPRRRRNHRPEATRPTGPMIRSTSRIAPTCATLARPCAEGPHRRLPRPRPWGTKS
jgi:hypothetical protein